MIRSLDGGSSSRNFNVFLKLTAGDGDVCESATNVLFVYFALNPELARDNLHDHHETTNPQVVGGAYAMDVSSRFSRKIIFFPWPPHAASTARNSAPTGKKLLVMGLVGGRKAGAEMRPYHLLAPKIVPSAVLQKGTWLTQTLPFYFSILHPQEAGAARRVCQPTDEWN